MSARACEVDLQTWQWLEHRLIREVGGAVIDCRCSQRVIDDEPFVGNGFPCEIHSTLETEGKAQSRSQSARIAVALSEEVARVRTERRQVCVVCRLVVDLHVARHHQHTSHIHHYLIVLPVSLFLVLYFTFDIYFFAIWCFLINFCLSIALLVVQSLCRGIFLYP